NVGQFGVPAVVAINAFAFDTAAEFAAVQEGCAALGVEAIKCTHFAEGSRGSAELAERVVTLAESGSSQFRPLYDDEMPLWDKVRTIARSIYGAEEIVADMAVRNQFRQLQEEYGRFPVCMAKTQYSFST